MSAAGFDVVIVGGGAAGITVAAQLRRHRKTLSIALIEPSETHAYQPGWTMVGAGVFSMKQTQRRQETLIPPGVTWFRIRADAFEPERNAVILADGRRLTYASLVLCPGLQLDWNRIEGLKDALGANGVCSNYASAHAEYTWRCIQELDGGTALFTQPAMPIKCAGAPQKIMYLASDALRRTGRLDRVDVEFCLSGSVLFGVPFFVPALQRSIDEYGIRVNYGQTLTAVDGPARKAVFSATGPDGQTREIVRDFDMLHVTPPQGPPDFIRNSPFADAAGWVSVDPETLQHTRFPNVFGLGDAAGTPNAKTAAAVRLQAPVVVRNLLAAVDGRSLTAAYDGYGSCPLTTAYGRVVLAEFGYGGRIMPSFPIDPRVPRFSAWLLKQNILPALYWNWMLKGSELDIRHRERTFEKAA